jgi:hypothetical protein
VEQRRQKGGTGGGEGSKEDLAIQVTDGSFAWDSKLSTPVTLQNINISVKYDPLAAGSLHLIQTVIDLVACGGDQTRSTRGGGGRSRER